MVERDTSILEDDESEQGTMKTERSQGTKSKLAVLHKHNSMKALPDRASERDPLGKKSFTGGQQSPRSNIVEELKDGVADLLEANNSGKPFQQPSLSKATLAATLSAKKETNPKNLANLLNSSIYSTHGNTRGLHQQYNSAVFPENPVFGISADEKAFARKLQEQQLDDMMNKTQVRSA